MSELLIKENIAKEIFEGWSNASDEEVKLGWYDWVAKWHIESTKEIMEHFDAAIHVQNQLIFENNRIRQALSNIAGRNK